MFDRENEWLKKLGSVTTVDELVDEDKPEAKLLLDALNDMIRAEESLHRQADRIEKDMAWLKEKLAKTDVSINGLGELQDSAQLNAFSAEYSATKKSLERIVKMYNSTPK